MKNIDIVIKSKKWFNFFKDENDVQINFNNIIKKISQQDIMKNLLLPCNNLEISFSLVNNNQIKKINKETRYQDKPTNILSFPHFDKDEINNLRKSKNNYIFLGDIVIAYEKIDNEAVKQNKKFKNHLTHLILHSILHLLGFDHQNDFEAQEMEDIEIKILDNLNIKNPYTNY